MIKHSRLLVLTLVQQKNNLIFTFRRLNPMAVCAGVFGRIEGYICNVYQLLAAALF